MSHASAVTAHETRSRLRHRFESQLPTPPPFRDLSPRITIDDEAMLRLLLDVAITPTADADGFRKAYAAAAQGVASAPGVADLEARGFLSLHLDRFTMGRFAREEMRADTTAELAPLRAVATDLYKTAYAFSLPVLSDAQLGATAHDIQTGKTRWSDLQCRRPAWVAARLWEESRRDPAPSCRLRRWLDQWEALQEPAVIVSEIWDEADATAFRSACLDGLPRDGATQHWQTERDRLVQLLARRLGSQAGERIGPVPPTAVERAAWIRRPLFESFDFFLFGGPYNGVMRLLLDDLAAAAHVTGSLSALADLPDMALRAPLLQLALMDAVERNPLVFADMLLSPASAPLAVHLLSRWPVERMDDREARDLRAFRRRGLEEGLAAALSSLTDLMATTPPDDRETAAVLIGLQEKSLGWDRRGVEDPGALRALRGLRAAWPDNRRQGVADALLARPPGEFLDDAGFLAALDHTRDGSITGAAEASALIGRYVDAIAPGTNTPGVRGLTPLLCAHLHHLSQQTTDADFLRPFDGPEMIKAADEPQRRAVAQRVAASLRAQIQVLCRALIGDAQPVAPIVDALAAMIRAGAVDNLAKGKVNAFGPSFERGPLSAYGQPSSVAVDLAQALARIEPKGQQQVLDALLSTDEPFILGELAELTDGDVRSALITRLSKLTPDEAPDSMFLTDEVVRVETLLDVGLVDLAEQYLDEHAQLATRGRGETRLQIFRFRARILATRGDLSGLSSLPVPAGLPAHQEVDASTAREFYRGILLQNRRAEGDLEVAADIFRRLQRRHPHIYAYQQNAIAMEISLLANGRPFDRLQGADHARGHALVEEAERLAANMSARPLALLSGNVAGLHLMLGEPKDALEALADADPGSPVTHSVRIAAYHDLGRRREALAAFDQAFLLWPREALIQAVGAYLRGSSPRANMTLILGGQDAVPAIRSALTAMRHLDGQSLADAHGFETVERLLLEQVRQASAALGGLRSAMRNLSLDTKEDDISRVLQALVRGRLEPLGWTVGDQGIGGYTASGNPGERDMVIYRGHTEAAAIEAVICRYPVTRATQVDDLRFHFVKLFGYSRARNLFHVTYSRTPDQAAVLSALETIARTDVPAGYVFREIHCLPMSGDAPAGRVALYEDPFGLVTVFFLVIDLDQSMQKAAAASATC